MGNIQLVTAHTRRKPIFDKHNSPGIRRSPTSRSDYYNQFKSNRMSKSNRKYKINDYSSFKKDKSGQHSGNQYKQIKTERKGKIQKGIRKQARMSRVSNFNDLIKQIKKQMTSHAQNTFHQQWQQAQLQQTLKIVKQIKRQPSSRQLIFNLRLQNEKLQLQKYKNIVQRQLSKNHSIENIHLETTRSNQKILVVKYEQHQSKYDKGIKDIQGIQTTRRNHRKLQQFCYQNEKKQKNSSAQVQQKKHYDLLQRSKEIIRQLQNRALGVQSFIQSYQQRHLQTKRIQTISHLIQEIHQIHNHQILFENKIKQIIQPHTIDDSESDYSGTFSYH